MKIEKKVNGVQFFYMNFLQKFGKKFKKINLYPKIFWVTGL